MWCYMLFAPEFGIYRVPGGSTLNPQLRGFKGGRAGGREGLEGGGGGAGGSGIAN